MRMAPLLSWSHPSAGTVCCPPPKKAEEDFCALPYGESRIQVLTSFTYNKALAKTGSVTV